MLLDHYSSTLMSVLVFLKTFEAFDHFIFNLIVHMNLNRECMYSLHLLYSKLDV